MWKNIANSHKRLPKSHQQGLYMHINDTINLLFSGKCWKPRVHTWLATSQPGPMESLVPLAQGGLNVTVTILYTATILYTDTAGLPQKLEEHCQSPEEQGPEIQRFSSGPFFAG